MKTMDSCALFEGIGQIDPVFIEEAGHPLGRSSVPPVRMTKAGALAASFVMVAMLLFGVNTAFPAFAESLPLVGEAFRRLNSLGANASTYDGVVQPVGVTAGNDEYSLTVTEAYCDGEYIFFALQLDPRDPRLLKMQTLETAEGEDGVPGCSITVDGKADGLNYELPRWLRQGCCFESAPVKLRLPRPVNAGAQLAVAVDIGSLRTQEAPGGEEGQIVSIKPVSLRFTLTADARHNQQQAAENAHVGSLRLTGWSSLPSKFSVTLAYPYFGPEGVGAAARTEDGTELGEDIRENGDLDGRGYRQGEEAVQTCTFIGVPEGARRVTVVVYQGRPEEERRVWGEFTIDLETGQVAAVGAEESWEEPQRTPAPDS